MLHTASAPGTTIDTMQNIIKMKSIIIDRFV